MPTFKNIRVKMRGGKSRLQRVQVLASGKYKFVKNLTKGKKRATKSTRSSSSKRSVRKTARRYRKKRRGGGGKSLTRTAFKLIRIGALIAPAAHYAMITASPENKIRYGLRAYTGYDMTTGSWDFGRLAEGWGAFLGACLATYGIPKITSILRKL